MNKQNKRAVIIVLDSVGCGELPDANKFGDTGANTLGHIADTIHHFDLPNLRKLGLAKIPNIQHIGAQFPTIKHPHGAYGRMNEVSIGKDTATGHWEFVGCILDEPFQTFIDSGFPDDIINTFIEKTGCGGVLGNYAASGTTIIHDLGQKHVETKFPIVYTSADPVFQIAAHEEIIPLETLYKWCKIAYDIVIPRGICRVIARPFIGNFPNYTRTSNRHDFTFPPPKKTLLDVLTENNIDVTGIGKIGDIYSQRGITRSQHTTSNQDGISKTINAINHYHGLIFTNLVDFDALYGHRRNTQGYAECLIEFDQQLPDIIASLDPGDLFLITADHGNDPTFPGTDHTREYVPILAFIAESPTSIETLHRGANVNLGTRASFADLGATVAEFFGVKAPAGESFLSLLK